MRHQKISRRDALGMIAKNGATFGAGTCFFLSLKTYPLAGAALDSALEEPYDQTQRVPRIVKSKKEKVVISGSGSTLIVRISGSPGRHCGIAFAKTDSKEYYKAVPKGRGIISKKGICTIKIDVKSLPNRNVFLRVLTGSGKEFTSDLKGTKPFEVQISRGVISKFKGTTTQALLDSKGSAAAAGYQYKKH